MKELVNMTLLLLMENYVINVIVQHLEILDAKGNVFSNQKVLHLFYVMNVNQDILNYIKEYVNLVIAI